MEEIEIEEQLRYQARLVRNEAEWKRRRCFDGFCVLLAHPNTELTPEQMCATYRAKDVVERDFRTIKSVIALRPLHHRTDAKVNAHITVCMLALALERIVANKLSAARSSHSPATALDELQQCRLNLYEPSTTKAPRYRLNKPTQEQQKLLRILRMQHLIEEGELHKSIAPR